MAGTAQKFRPRARANQMSRAIAFNCARAAETGKADVVA